jgi:hypothetical protein
MAGKRSTMPTRSETQTKAKAATIWKAMDKSQMACVRIGMFPAEIMQAAEKEGFNGKDLCVALMDCAKADGGMRA